MAFVHEDSCECSKTELDLFLVPPTQTAIESSQHIEHRPLSSLSDGAPIEFAIMGSGDEYLDLSDTYMLVTVKINNPNGSSLAEADNAIGPVNNWIHSLFSQVDVTLNDRLVTPSTNTYAYRAYIENLLSYGPAAKESHLTSAMWYTDTSGYMNDTSTNNLGFNLRKSRTALSAKVTLVARPHIDLAFQDRFILNGVDIKMRFVLSKSLFNLMGTAVSHIDDMSLFVRKVKVSPSVVVGHLKAMEHGTAKYPIRRVETKVFSIPKGNLSANQENLFLGQLPKRVIIGMVDNAAFNGTADSNPFEFKHNSVDFVSLYMDGVQFPSKPYKPDFNNKLYARSYLSVFSGTGMINRDQGNGISYSDYANGFSLWGFDLSPDLNDGSHFNVTKHGNLRLELRFKEALTVTINVIVYAEFDNVIEIDSSRNVLFDYSA